MNDLTLIIPAKDESDSLPRVLNSLKNLTCKIKVSLQINDKATIDSINDKNIEIFYQFRWVMKHAFSQLVYNFLLCLQWKKAILQQVC